MWRPIADRLQTVCTTARVRGMALSKDIACAPKASISSLSSIGLRVITYNVRRFTREDGSSSAAAIGDALASLQPSVVALNEVDTKSQPEALSLVAEKLGGFFVAFFGHVRGSYGNALLSRYPIAAIRETHLRGGTEVRLPTGTKKLDGNTTEKEEHHRIVRGLLECDIEIPIATGAGRVFTFAVTHLDHIREDERHVQITHLLEALGRNASRAVVVGDMNALTRSDYTNEEWLSLEERAIANGWRAPSSGCLYRLSDVGFTDAFAESRGHEPLSKRAAAGEDPIFTAHVGHPLYRIDYCFASHVSGLRVTEANVHTDIVLSDHFPVSFDFCFALEEARL